MAVESVTTFEPKPFGRYVLLDKLAVGGMAEIYKAKTYGVDGFEKLLAIKRILPHCAADKEFISMLVDEAKLTVLLSHANIVQVFDLGKVGDDYFISMEYINGTNLREVMRRLAEQGEKIPEETAVYIISEMCKGLDYAHRKTDTQGNPLNIVHRDISPQNILISYEGEVKIVDFGIAKAAMNVSHTMAGILKGKIAYMSPEQALGKPLDHRTDIFSAAIMLYEMLTGEKLYSGESQFEVLNKIRTIRVTASMLPEQISSPLKAILIKGLAYSSKDRYQNAGDFQLDLTKHLYSTYIDFSPRNLAALVSRLFAQEIKKREIAPIIDEKTRSVLIRQAAQAQEELVVHGATPQATAITQKTAASVASRLETPKKIGRAAVVGGIAALLMVGGYLGYRFLSQKEAPPRPPVAISEYGSFQIFTQPVGAKIILDGGETGLTTPASLDKLELGKQYEIRLVKENYREFGKKFTVTSTKPIQIQETLSALALGVISINSNPQGANILVNGKETSLKTPALVENLEINKSYDIKLTLADHAEWNGSVEVKDFDPVKLAATLTTVPKQPVQDQVRPPPPPPPDDKKVAPAYGQIEITSDPLQARVLLNGRDTGQLTPATLKNVEAGKGYSISVTKKGYEGWSRKSVIVASGETTRLVASLKKEAEEIAKPPPPLPPPPPPDTGGGLATLQVSSEPVGADVYINSEYKGTTPATITDVPTSAKLVVTKSGYLKFIQQLSLKAGEARSLGTIKLEDLFGELSLNSTPPQASIYIDGELIGVKTPVTIKKVPRDSKHSVRLVLEGYQPWESVVDLKDQAGKMYNVTLEKE